MTEVRDMGLLVSAIERPRTNVFGAELYPSPTPHEKAARPLLSAGADMPRGLSVGRA